VLNHFATEDPATPGESALILKAYFMEAENGKCSVRTEGVTTVQLDGSCFKEVMIQLVSTVNMLKKVHALPDGFELKKHLRVYFE
jgi:hypothetical protein